MHEEVALVLLVDVDLERGVVALDLGAHDQRVGLLDGVVLLLLLGDLVEPLVTSHTSGYRLSIFCPFSIPVSAAKTGMSSESDSLSICMCSCTIGSYFKWQISASVRSYSFGFFFAKPSKK